MSEPKEFRVTMQLRNNRMLEIREAHGWTQHQAAAACGVAPQAWGGLETLREHPMRWYGGGKGKPRFLAWSQAARAISVALEVEPEKLWPEAVQGVKGGRHSLRVGADEARALMGSVQDTAQLVDGAELAEQTRKVLATLTMREEKVLRMRFGIGEKSDHTLEEVGQEFEVGRGRIQQIEAKALRKLRRPSIARGLAPFVADDVRKPGDQ